MNELPIGLLWSMLAGMLMLSAFFSGSETALMMLNRYRLKHMVKMKHRGAEKAQHLLQRPDRLISLILLGNVFANIAASSITTVIAIRLYGEEESIITVAAIILTIVVLIFSEVTPKTLAAAKPETLAFPSAWIYQPLMKLTYPLVFVINLTAHALLRLVGVRVQKQSHETLNKEELRTVVTEAESLIPIRYQKMLLGILDLESATVEDIMTPRNDIYGVDLELPLDDIIHHIQNSPHTRLPVYKKSIDRVIGFLHLRNVVTKLEQEGFDKQMLTNILTKPAFIPDSTPIHKQIQHFKNEKLRIGLVVDEYGDVQGLITLDDLLQEIVGELVTDEATVKKLADGSYLVDAGITVRELNRLMQWELPTEGPKTLNGLIVEFMETIPEEGTSVKLHGYPLEIVKRDQSSVRSVKFLRSPK